MKRPTILAQAAERRCAVCGERTSSLGYWIATDEWFCDAHRPRLQTVKRVLHTEAQDAGKK
jgi:hypothetical protein